MPERSQEARKAVEARVRSLVEGGRHQQAAGEALRALGPEVLGYLRGMMGSDADGDEVFAAVSTRVWRGLAAFEWRCSLRTWVYLLAHREMARFRQQGRRHAEGRVPLSQIQSIMAEVRSTVTGRSALRQKLAKLREELPEEDQELLVLRVDRNLEWDEIALIFSKKADDWTDADTKREAARLRKRFQLIKERLAKRFREEGLTSD
jgi:RNA polymerase sigma-70 factor (ECF subfamily)